MTSRSRLVLGTAQLGMNYGIANATGQPDAAAASEMVSSAIDGGILEFDTAQAYGSSESILGQALCNIQFNNKVRIISKLLPAVDLLNTKETINSVSDSLERLSIQNLHGLLLHDENQLDDWSSGISESFQHAKSKRLIRLAGVSVYSPERSLQALNTDGIDVVQIPSSLFDRRFEKAGIFEKAKSLGKTIYVRSIFLQGLAFMKVDTLPAYMAFVKPYLVMFEEILRKWELTPLEAALGYVRQCLPDSRIIFGAESPLQILSNLEAWDKELPTECILDIRDTFSNVPEQVLNPALWPSNSD